ncbi:glycosyltransferase [Phycicoccus endophyticus]|uniref:Glycosyltransferase n=1 Tax=Phycicoccus endophyticus TaxID=1690220 RepID=A0A7G9R2T4_9MICO|nr:glycosyltransferase [Phycicoccus endophyticus]NHI20377.1 glycosyltransferase [Phycicoccus endophyticus]QNN49909.1 glycosyltransferase [Phycicoccus endophyticus]GGL29734.1 hypothetical protein GCM10012283_10100 [Phycicoccus endophyticus]
MTADSEHRSVPDPSVGVILTTYNGQDHLEEQLDSLLAQVGVSVHIYVFDDGSSDGTVPLLSRYAAAHPESFSIFESSVNSGGTGLNIFRNTTRLPSGHDFLALSDQDDVWLPHKLRRAVDALMENDADLYFSDLVAWDGGLTELSIVTRARPPRARDHLFGGGSAGCTYVLSARFFAHLQDVLRHTDLSGVRRISHDWVIYFLARHDGFNVWAAPEALIKYRIHADSQYGGMSQGGLGAMRRKWRMLRSGFLEDQVYNSLRFARHGTEDREILAAFTRGRWSRVGILMKYRFSLVRKKARFLGLAAAFVASRAVRRGAPLPEGRPQLAEHGTAGGSRGAGPELPR